MRAKKKESTCPTLKPAHHLSCLLRESFIYRKTELRLFLITIPVDRRVLYNQPIRLHLYIFYQDVLYNSRLAICFPLPNVLTNSRSLHSQKAGNYIYWHEIGRQRSRAHSLRYLLLMFR